MTETVGAPRTPSPAGPPPGPEKPPSGRGPLWVVAAVVAVVVAIGVGLGVTAVANHRAEVAAAERQARAERRAAEEEQALREREAEQLAARQEAYDSCLSQLEPLLDALRTVDARLNVGLSEDEFSDLVGDASVAYSRIEVAELGDLPCLRAGAKLESALGSYRTVASRWNDCIFDFSCDVDSIDPMMQRKWASAARAIERAAAMLDRMDPAGPASSGTGQST